MVNMMKVLLTHQTFGVGKKLNVNLIKVWHKMIKLWVDNNEGFACTLNPWYRNENIAHNNQGWED